MWPNVSWKKGCPPFEGLLRPGKQRENHAIILCKKLENMEIYSSNLLCICTQIRLPTGMSIFLIFDNVFCAFRDASFKGAVWNCTLNCTLAEHLFSDAYVFSKIHIVLIQKGWLISSWLFDCSDIKYGIFYQLAAPSIQKHYMIDIYMASLIAMTWYMAFQSYLIF